MAFWPAKIFLAYARLTDGPKRYGGKFMKIARREMVMEMRMKMKMAMAMAMAKLSEWNFLIKRIDIKYTPSGTWKNCCTLQRQFAGKLSMLSWQKYSFFFSFSPYPSYRQVATIMRRQLAENCERRKVVGKPRKMSQEQRLFNAICKLFSLDYRHFWETQN